MEIQGALYDGKTSAQCQARLTASPSGMLRLSWDNQHIEYSLEELEVSSRLGNTPRYLSFPDGRKFETRDNRAVDELLRQHSRQERHGWQALLHQLESRMHYVLLSFVVVVAFSWATVEYALPAAAEKIAFALPQNIMQQATDTTLKVLDEHYLEASDLSDEEQQRLTARFIEMTRHAEQGFRYRILFRKGGEGMGANAFALPAGTIVVTDELVRIAHNDDELMAVLAHELGHVVHRHSLRQVLQNSVLTLLVTYTTGDVGSIFIALPLLFVELGYSRRFEREADQFAYDFMLQRNIPLASFASILEEIEASQEERHERAAREAGGEGRVTDIFEYLSTHPATEERVQRFRQAEAGM